MTPATWPFWAQSLLAFAAGGIVVLGFAPFSIGLITIISVALLIRLWRDVQTPRQGALLGYAFGLGLMGFGVSWIRISIAQFGGVHEALAISITALFVALMAIYYGLVGWLVVRLRRTPGAAWLLLIVPGIWVLLEWLRGWLFTGFPWLALGYSQIDLPLLGFATLLGVYGVTFGIVLTAGLINLWPRLPAALAVLAIWGGGALLQTVTWVEPAAAPIRVSLLQGNIPQAQKWLAEMREATLSLYQSMTDEVSDSVIVVWPETAVPAFDTAVEDSLLRPLDAKLRAQGRDVLLGIVAAGQQGAYYNAMLSLGVSGRDSYHKRRLVPFGEYLPLATLLRPILDFIEIPMSDFSAGDDSKPLVMLGGQPVGVDICYEDAYAEEIIRALPEATLLVNASNDAWFGDSLAPHQHLEIARMRAVETSRFLLRSTNTGISAIIDHQGQLRGTSPQFEQATLTDEVTPLTGLTPFARWGHRPIIVLSLSTVLLGWLMTANRRKSAS